MKPTFLTFLMLGLVIFAAAYLALMAAFFSQGHLLLERLP